jgi:hypothetical protein
MDLKDLTPLINQTAASTHRAYNAWVSFPDVAGHLWLWAVDNEDRVEDYLAREDGERIVRSILSKEARTYAIKERAVSSGYTPEDLTWYSPNMIRRILPDVFDHEDWQSFQSSGNEVKSKPVASATGDRLASILDVKKGVNSLPEDTVFILREHYGRGISIDTLADELEILPDTLRKRLDRAVYAIRDALGGPRPTDPYEAVNGQFDTRAKGRKAMSNAQANAITSNQWDGD